MNHTLAIIGAGNMGGAFYRALSEKRPEFKVSVFDRNREKLDALSINTQFENAAEAIRDASAVLIAVKPQSARELLTSLPAGSLKDRLVISIMAGISLSRLEELTGSSRIIRSMPNLPAQIGQGLTGWIGSQGLTDNDREFTRDLFTTVGKELELPSEKTIDAFGALSGCGPAYFFFLAEMISERALREGFSAEEAGLISRETLIGSGALLDSHTRTPEEWRIAVSSKGGVTEAAIRTMKEEKIEELFSNAIDSAIARTRELNQ